MQLIPFNFPSIPQVHCSFQTIKEGDSVGPYAEGNISFTVGDCPQKVLNNRQHLLQSLELKTWSELNQVHGDELVLNAEPTPINNPTLISADGLATSKPGLGLMIKTADCQPILIASLDGQHIAGLHVGWQGNLIGFIGKAVAEFCQSRKLKPQNLAAVRGPSLSPEKSEFSNFEEEWGKEFRTWYNQKTRTMDLWKLTHDQLMVAGLESNNIFSLDLCTYIRADLFFSHRRDKGISGRQASFIWID